VKINATPFQVLEGKDVDLAQWATRSKPLCKSKKAYLWRTTRDLPERGRIGIFNRSYYEEVLIARVHSSILLSEHIPDIPEDRTVWEGRFRSIVDLERHLHINGTRIVKVFMHISKEEQRLRLLARIDEPDKNWKFSLADITERKHWDAYMQAYAHALSATSTADSPWFIVPADDKDNARLIVSQIVLDALLALKLSYPEVNSSQRQQLQAFRKQLAA
jgi:PPK2 family polyphosphate:nucleotide phosphotransferase